MRKHPKMQKSVTTYPSAALWVGERIEPLTCKHSVLFLLPWFCPIWGFSFVSFPLLIPVYMLPEKKKKSKRLLSGPQSPAGEWRQLIKIIPLFFQPGGRRLSGLSRFEPNQQWSMKGQAVRSVSGQRILQNLCPRKGGRESAFPHLFAFFTRIKPSRIPKN